jgi:hypothetical protein
MFNNTIDLTSYDRVRYFLELTQDNPVSKRAILNWISTVSARVQDFLAREVLIKSRVEYKNVSSNQNCFPIQAYPITSITLVESDSTGLYSNPSEVLDAFIGVDQSTIRTQYPLVEGQNGVRITYLGGLCYHATQSIYTFSSVSGLVVGQFIEGQSSYALGKVKSITGLNVKLEVLFGRFQVTEEFKVWNTDALTGELESLAGTITASVELCLAETHPLIVTATEMEIRYLHTHKKDLENIKSSAEGTDRREATSGYELQPEVRSYLQHYQRIMV